MGNAHVPVYGLDGNVLFIGTNYQPLALQASWDLSKILWSLATNIHKQYGLYFESQKSLSFVIKEMFSLFSKFEHGTFRS